MLQFMHMFSLADKNPYGWRPLLLWVGAAFIGLAAYALGECASLAFGFFRDITTQYVWWPFFSLITGGLFLTWFMHRVGPGTEGSGIQQAVAAMQVSEHPEQISWLINLKLASAKFFALIVGTASGFVVGLEGPTVQIGSSILYSCRKVLPQDNAVFRRQLIMAGGAAGIAAAFSAPMAGLMFAFEEMGRHVVPRSTARTAVAVVLSGTVAYAVSGRERYFGEVSLSLPPSLHVFGIMLVVVVLGALAGGFFSWLAIRTNKWLPWPVMRFRMKHPYLFVVACATLLALCGLLAPVYGSGVELTKHMLYGHAAVEWYYLPLKILALLLTCLCGIPGGVFAPSLAIGAGLGSWFLPLVDMQWGPEILSIGMVSVLAAVTRAPMTAAFIMIEMTDGHAMVLEMLAAAMIAVHIARNFHVHFYHSLAMQALHTMPESLKKEEENPA
ncbi:chloride channel protein [Desulfovibrio sp. OttesenSCG-928-G15]|nr:chloride channel protein [Desulfovibrio sp. OttesenSCG-928-G15]